MLSRIRNIMQLTWKELISLRRDTFMVIFVIYSFSFAVYSQATGISQELADASIAVVDEDHSALAHRIVDAIMPPLFQLPVALARDEIDPAMDRARFTFVVDIPPDFEADVRANRSPTVQVLVDATAMMQAGLGANYLNTIIQGEVAKFLESVRTSGSAACRGPNSRGVQPGAHRRMVHRHDGHVKQYYDALGIAFRRRPVA